MRATATTTSSAMYTPLVDEPVLANTRLADWLQNFRVPQTSWTVRERKRIWNEHKVHSILIGKGIKSRKMRCDATAAPTFMYINLRIVAGSDLPRTTSTQDIDVLR